MYNFQLRSRDCTGNQKSTKQQNNSHHSTFIKKNPKFPKWIHPSSSASERTWLFAFGRIKIFLSLPLLNADTENHLRYLLTSHFQARRIFKPWWERMNKKGHGKIEAIATLLVETLKNRQIHSEWLATGWERLFEGQDFTPCVDIGDGDSIKRFLEFQGYCFGRSQKSRCLRNLAKSGIQGIDEVLFPWLQMGKIEKAFLLLGFHWKKNRDELFGKGFWASEFQAT